MLLMILSIVDDIGSNSVFDGIEDSKFSFNYRMLATLIRILMSI